jgi:hypothetical protein
MCESSFCDCECHSGGKPREDFLSDEQWQRIRRDVAGQDFVSIMENCTLDVPQLVRALDFYRDSQRLRLLDQLFDHCTRLVGAGEEIDPTGEEKSREWIKKTVNKLLEIEERKKNLQIE